MAKRLTHNAVEHAKPIANKRRHISDGGSGLYLVVQSSGHKSWACWYRLCATHANAGKQRKFTLGDYPALSLAAARADAASVLKQVAQGHDPRDDKQASRQQSASAVLVDDAFRSFLDNYDRTKGKGGRPIRESTRVETGRLLGFRRDPKTPDAWIASGNGALAKWRGRALASITQTDVQKLVDSIKAGGHPVAANRTLAALKTCFRWHVGRQALATSPAANVDDPSGEEPRERTLTDDELRALWRAADNDASPFGRMVHLLILTGVRRDEARDATWKEFGEREWSIPGNRTKNANKHIVPLAGMARALLKSMPRVGTELLFTTNSATPISGLAKCKKRLEAAMATELGYTPDNWRLHDIRRTFVSGLQKLKVPVEVAAACINHRSGIATGATSVYTHYDYAPEKRAALGAWDQHVAELVSPRTDKVVRRRTRA